MAIYDQITRHGGFVDIVCKNTGATSITAGLVVQFEDGDTGTDYPHVKAIAASDTVVRLAGVAVDTIAAGAAGRICVHGPAVALASAAFYQGQLLQTLMSGGSCDGKVLSHFDTTTQEAVQIVGRALTPSSAASDYVEVFVNICPVTTAA